MRRKGIGVLLGVTLLSLALPWPAEGAFPGRNGKLAFAFYSLPQLNMDIWTIDPDGQNYTRLTTAPEADRKPAWSANGRWIAFERAGNIWVMRFDGTDPRLVADLASPATSPAWSPDGRRIVFAAGIEPPEAFDPDFDLYVANMDGTGLTKLVSQPNRSEFDPSWSPDGTRIAFAGDLFGRCPSVSCAEVSLGLHTIAAEGTGEQLVTRGRFQFGTCVSQPDWSPDGAKIAFTDCARTYTVNVDGGGLVGYPSDELIHRVDPSWSPDGTRIAFTALLGHMSAVDGTSLVVLGTGFDVSWQPLGPRREAFGNRPAFCRADREFLGEEEFAAEYRNFGGCVSAGRG